MAKDYFSVENTTSLTEIKEGGKIHIIGVAGVAMGQLAVALATRGYDISGSDKRFYEPMGSFLRSSPVTLCEGYRAENVPADVDLVVIGNAISYGHEEVAVVEERDLPYSCFPQMLFEAVIAGKHSIVACGTHGKSTTTALAASLLEKLGTNPSYFVGGVCFDLPTSLKVDAGEFSVVEGDEYDSAFFAKVPKFTFYKPDTCIINAVEFDHADIYPTLEDVEREFTGLVTSLSRSAHAICCNDFEGLKRLIGEWKQQAECNIITFGTDPDSHFRIIERSTSDGQQTVRVRSQQFGEFTFTTPLIGEYNARNVLAVTIAALINNRALDEVLAVIPELQGVKRRQEVRLNNQKITFVEDFAHHPTSVAQTIMAVKEAYPGRRVIVAFEPRSAASRRRVFQQEYINAFIQADSAVISAIEQTAYDSGHELLDIVQLSADITDQGTPCCALDGAEEIASRVISETREGDVVLVMSNGSFGGLLTILEDRLSEKFC